MKHTKKRVIEVAITGILGSGKSSLCLILSDMGFAVLNADSIAHQLYKTDTKFYYQITEMFGKAVLREDRSINRKALGDIVFNDPLKLKKLNSILHQEVYARMKFKADKLIENNYSRSFIFFEIPILFESCGEKKFDFIVTVSADMEIIKTRLIERGLSLSRISIILANQLPLSYKEKRSHYVIHNNNSIKDLKKSADSLIKYLKKTSIKRVRYE